MKLAHHYRTLGLGHSASFIEIKSAYRRLVRQYHPDLNPNEQAIAKFIAINEAYTALLDALPKAPKSASSSASELSDDADFRQRAAAAERLNLDELKRTLEKLGLGNFQKADYPHKAHPDVANPDRANPDRANPDRANLDRANLDRANLDEASIDRTKPGEGQSVEPPLIADQGLKQDAYEQLRALLGQQKFPRAIALVEGLSNRLPTDVEINQWRAIVYQRWGRQLIHEGQLRKANIYLKKAMRVDPHNPDLACEVEQDLARLAILRRG
ncbi:MAG: DnaJ domain-containing protein [Cyanobacteria bacterium P01_D01_bin.1]